MQKCNIKLIDNFLKENNLTKTEFCKRCKISKYSLSKIYKNDFNIDIVVIIKISYAINQKPCDLFIND